MSVLFRSPGAAAFIAAWVFCEVAVAGAEAPAKKQPSQPPAAGPATAVPTYRVRKEPFRIEISLKGVFEAARKTEVALAPEEWAQLKVLEAVEAGARVSKGDSLVVLDTRKIDEAIRDLESGIKLSDIAVKQTEEELGLLENSLPLDLEAAKQSMEMADQDLLRFLKIDKELSVTMADNSVKNMENYLEYEMEELRQLERMYKADDLTEETEEIILKRQRDTVERMKFSVKSARITRDRTLQVTLPRQEDSLKESARRKTLSWEKARNTLPLAVDKKRLELEKTKSDSAKSVERFSKLRRDRKAMNVTSPADGVVYYGRCIRGRWQNTSTTAAKLRRGGTLTAHEVFMTIVDPRPLRVRAAVPEKELHLVASGLKGKAVPTGFPDLKLPARLKEVSAIPTEGESFDATITVKTGEREAALMPGMTCTLYFVPYSKKSALTVPAEALFIEEEADGKHFVYVKIGPDHEKRYVTPGRKSDKKVEILKGLEDGDEILLKKPEE